MTIRHGTICALAVWMLASAGAGNAQEMPKPGPEHAVLTQDVGTWDATVEMAMAPGQPPSVSKGVETNTLLGELWLIQDFKSEMMGQPFAGHGVAGYDPQKKKYVSTWVDSMSTWLAVSDNTWDPATKTMTGWMEGPDMTGKMIKMRAVMEHKDADTRHFAIWSPGPDGKEVAGLKITYKRRK